MRRRACRCGFGAKRMQPVEEESEHQPPIAGHRHRVADAHPGEGAELRQPHLLGAGLDPDRTQTLQIPQDLGPMSGVANRRRRDRGRRR